MGKESRAHGDRVADAIKEIRVKNMSALQEKLNNAFDRLDLNPGEYEGPLVIDRPITIDGHDSTIWANSGPVVVVNSDQVSLKNLRIELTGSGGGDSGVSLRLNARDTRLDHIEVNAQVFGLPEESADIKPPSIISLGTFAANKENSFSVEIESPAEAEILHSINGVEITPQRLGPGKNRVVIKTTAMRDNTILFGEMLMKTRVLRRVYLSGKSVKGAEEHQSETPVSGKLPISTPIQFDPPDDVIAPVVSEDVSVVMARKGQRVSAGELSGCELKIVCEHNSSRQIDLDPYVFLLGKNGKARSDSDLIFFGNSENANGSVRVNSQNRQALAIVRLRDMEPEVERICIAYSIYDEQDGGDFSCVDRLALTELTTERTIVAVELYRYKGEWKISFVGGGYGAGLNKLCNDYGIDVE